jgi:hypothetical protein
MSEVAVKPYTFSIDPADPKNCTEAWDGKVWSGENIEGSLVDNKHMPSNIKTRIIFSRKRKMWEITEKRHLITTKKGTVLHYMLNLHIIF